MRCRFDAFGVFIIGFVTAVGGGTIRDILIENKQVFWFSDTSHIYVILAGTIIAILFRPQMTKARKPLLVFDAIGLGLYTITGVQIGLDANLPIINCIILGTITGVFGGVARDILVNEVPEIFRKEVYATISLAGGAFYVLLSNAGLSSPFLQTFPILVIIAGRLLVLYFKISLPTIYRRKGSKN